MLSLLVDQTRHFQHVPALLAIAVLAAAVTYTYRVYSHPLNAIPGPFIAKWTVLRLKRETISGTRPTYIDRLHHQYGPIVRLAPNEISVADVDAARIVYKVGSPYLKTSFYDGFAANNGVRTVFTMTEPKAHGIHRQNTAFYFSEKYVAKLEPFIIQNVQRAISRMAEQMQTDGFADVFKWWFFMATDVVGEAAFGESFKMLESGQVNDYIHDLQSVIQAAVLKSEFPLLRKIAMFIPSQKQRDLIETSERMSKYGEASVKRYWKLLQDDPDNVKPTLLTKSFSLVDKKTLPLGQLIRDAVGYIVAGTDTTSNTLTYTTWELAHHPEVERELISEVAALPEGYTDKDLMVLPYLNGVINEGLRLHPAVPGGLPRYVPSQGAQFCGHFIPGGTVVGIPAITMQLDPFIWPDAENFDPQRWSDTTRDQRDHFLPFGGGSRICLGMHFARLEMRHAMAAFYRTFTKGVEISSAEGFSAKDMQGRTFFIKQPVGERCLVKSRE